jgi:hypothetical protein
MNGTATDALTQTNVKAFMETLREAGWIEGKNISIDIRYNAGDAALARIACQCGAEFGSDPSCTDI